MDNKPLVIQSDFTIMLEVSNPSFDEIKDEVIKFAEVDQSPEYVYIFKITDLSIWNALAMNISKEEIFSKLEQYSTYGIPDNIVSQINIWCDVYGQILLKDTDKDNIHLLEVKDSVIKEEINRHDCFRPFIEEKVADGFLIKNTYRGEIKSLLMKIGYPVEDTIGFTKGIPINIKLQDWMKIRDYQEMSSKAINVSGHGTVVLPCGSGKTVVGINLMSLAKTTTLIVTNSSASVNQWKASIVKMTNISEDQISVYAGKNKEIKPITICTYNMLSYKKKNEGFIHFDKISKYDWGLAIYDEVHLMPANMFRIVSSLQSSKRLALTATFVREDGRERDIFTLIGPKRFDKPWKDLEAKGFIANISLTELRVTMSDEGRRKYNGADNGQEKFEIASTDKNKIKVIKDLMTKHKDDKILIIGQFTEHLKILAEELDLPFVYGKTSTSAREDLYKKMRDNEINALVASKVANAALDIPDINVVIQVSFQYGSRNEEAQRAGRATRPKEKAAFFYTIICKDTKEEQYNFNRQQFLTGEGYKYRIKEWQIAA